MMTYSGNSWTNNKGYLLELLYLGSDRDDCNSVFHSTKQKVTLPELLQRSLPPSPRKDPAFPAWWEAHRAEWETQ